MGHIWQHSTSGLVAGGQPHVERASSMQSVLGFLPARPDVQRPHYEIWEYC